MTTKKNKKANLLELITYLNPSSPIAEQYRTIRTNLQFVSVANQNLKTFVVTSSEPGEGKTTTSSNLAIAFADSGKKVLLIDADMRKGRLHEVYGLPNTRGLSNNLISREATVKFIRKVEAIENLSILSSGPKPLNPSELLGSFNMDSILEEVKTSFDIVILDMPPVLLVTDSQLIAAKTDGTILVARENYSLKESIIKSKKSLEVVNSNLLGVIYNGKYDKHADKDYYYGGE